MLLVLNAKLVNTKAPLVHCLTEEEQANLACITETWVTPEGSCPLRDMFSHVSALLQGKGDGVAIVIRESFVAFRGIAPQISDCETLFLKIGSRDIPPCCVTNSLPEILQAVFRLLVEFP